MRNWKQATLFLLLALGLYVPVQAQTGFPFVIRVEQSGRAFTVANGATITLTSPAVETVSTARITLTFIGNTRASISSTDLSGSPDFSLLSSGSIVLLPGQSTTLDVTYRPTSVEGALSQLSLPFLVDVANSTPTTGIVLLSLAGTVPSFVVSYVNPADSNTVFVPNGGAIQFPQSIQNAAIDAQLSITNRGSGTGRVNSIALDGSGFLLVGVPLLPISIPAGSEIRLTLRFLPRSLGQQNATLRIGYESAQFAASVTGEALRSFFTYELVNNGSITPIEPDETITLPSVRVGDRSSVLIRLTNVRSLPNSLTTLGLTNTAFTITEAPPVPLILQPNQTTAFRLNFRPTVAEESAGYLLVNSDTFPIRSTGLGAQLRLTYRVGTIDVPLTGTTIFFPQTAIGQTQNMTVTLRNEGTAPAPLVSIGVTDTRRFFTLTSPPSLPAEVGPGDSLSFGIRFAPTAPGQATGQLVVDGTAITLSGFVEDAPVLPTYRFTGASGNQDPFTQPAIGLALDRTYPTEIRGVLTLAVVPDNFAIDPAVQFATGGREVSFRIPANSLNAVFANESQTIRFQTGTVSTQLVFTPSFATSSGSNITPDNPTTLRITVPARQPVLLVGRVANRTLVSLSVIVNGFASSRSLQKIDFEFVPREGASVEGLKYSADITAEARAWFQSAASQTAGGQFSVEVPFTLSTGSTSTPAEDLVGRIQSVVVTVSNELGTSNRLTIPVQ